MQGARGPGQSSIGQDATSVEMVEELGCAERQAIEAGDWDRLEEILNRQKALWRELLGDARRDDDSRECREAIDALGTLYEVRRRNHALIEHSFGELRRKLTTAHTGSGARSAYERTLGRAA